MSLNIIGGIRAFWRARALGYAWRDCFTAARLFAFRADVIAAVLRDKLDDGR